MKDKEELKPCERCCGSGFEEIMGVGDNMDVDLLLCQECNGTGKVRTS